MDIDLALNSDAKGDEKELANFNKYYPLIANKDDFEDIYYLWIVKQAKNVMESSLVLFASNSATGTLENKTEAVDDTLENDEAEQSLQQEETHKELLKQLLKKF